MTNGGGEGGSQLRKEKGKLSRGNDFAYAVAKMAVTQICESIEIRAYQDSQAREGVRFSSFQESALETLTDVVVQYIQGIGKSTQFYANMAGRVEGNALDIVLALEDMGSGLGFDGAPDIEQCLSDSGVVKDIIRYAGEAEEMPFVYSLPRFPFNKGKRPAPSFSEIGAEPPDEHIPVWLPAFPETKICNGAEETNVGQIEGDLQSNENGQSLASMLQSVQTPTEEPEGNPFLAATVWVGEKNMPHVFCPQELRNGKVSISHAPEKQMNKSPRIPPLEAIGPSDKVNGKNILPQTEDGEKKDGARTQRPLLRFKIGTRKSSRTINQSLEKMGWFQEVGDKREKKVDHEEKRGSIDTDVK
ncbi:unnamed protein product [Cochlearia groenlandica]